MLAGREIECSAMANAILASNDLATCATVKTLAGSVSRRAVAMASSGLPSWFLVRSWFEDYRMGEGTLSWYLAQ